MSKISNFCISEERRAHETAVDDLAARLSLAEDQIEPVKTQPEETGV